jgi:hypothetical protein
VSPRRESAGLPRNGIPPRGGGPKRRRRRIAAGIGASGILVAALGAGFLAGPGESAPRVPTQRPPLATGFPGGPYVAIVCGVSHRNNDDAIVFPGAPGKSHNHTYVGNRSVDASTTAESLAGGPTSCDTEADSSAYWFPTLFVGDDDVNPLAVIVYYVKRVSGDVIPHPAGLKMIAGRADAKSRQPKGIVGWSCRDWGGKPRYAVIPACSGSQSLQLQVNFPNCWNGKALDSPDHKRHVAYASRGRCPASHPKAMPTLALILLYPPMPLSAQVSSGRFGIHADFIEGWKRDVFEKLVARLN